MIRRDYIEGVFVAQIVQFSQMFADKVFPTFANPEAQAEQVSHDYWEQKMSEPCGPEGPDDDFGSIADDAQQKGIEYYETMHAMHFTVVNLFTAGLFHLFEQQVGTLLKDWTDKRPKYPVDTMKGLDWTDGDKVTPMKDAPRWADLLELNLVANVIKHAEGNSADKLRALNPIHFELPAVRGTSLERDEPFEYMLGEPLTGEGIYITKEEYDRFSGAVIEFWKWVGNVIG